MFDFFNLYVLRNQKLIYFLLQSIKDYIPEEYREKYALQIDCISKIQWVLDVEVNLYCDDSVNAYLIPEWEEEKTIVKVIITDQEGKTYRLNFFVVSGQIFSIESNLPFRYLKIDHIHDLQVCI